MKIQIKNGYCPNYLTLGKVYEVVDEDEYPQDGLFTINCDYGSPLTIFLPSCPHLNGGEWELVDG
jgi:hypothetical protein